MQMAGQYAPVASGHPFTPDFGFEGTPLADNPLLGMILQPIVGNLMGKMGMAPMGLNDRNVFDTLSNQRFYRQQQDVQRRMAATDQASWMMTLRGMAHVTGAPWGADQMRAARGMTDAAVHLAPTLNMLAPEIMDEMGGYRGSAAVMAARMMMAGRYRLDPVTGKMGQAPEQVAAQAQKLFADLYENGKFSDMQGVSAGQLGTLYEQLSQRGLIGGSTKTPYDEVRGLARSDKKLFDDALDRIGAKGTDASKLTSDQLDKLTLDPAVADKLRGFDTEKTKKSLQGYLHAVNAIKDIFGDLGRPNAPMSELIGALEAMTNGSIGQIQPGQLNMLVRQTHQIAQATGVSNDNAMAMQEHLSGRARQMGLEPVFAVTANQGGMAFGAAFRQQGLEPAWGRMNPDQMTMLDGQLRLNAAASKSAQRAGLALRLNERLGGFDPNSDAGRYVAGLKSAQDTGYDYWIDANGEKQSLNLDQAAFTRIMTATGKVDAGQLGSMMGQKFANREYVQRYGVEDVIRRSQGKKDVQPWVGSQLQGFLQGQLRQAGVGDKEARASAAAIAQTAAAEIMSMDPADFANNERRTAKIGEILQRNLAGTEAGKALGGKLGGFATSTGESFYGFWSEVTRLSPDFSYLGNAQNMFNAFHETTTTAGTRIQTTERMNAQIKTALAPLNRGSMVRRAMGYLQNAKEGDADLAKLVATALGGVEEKDVREGVLPQFAAIKREQEALEQLQRQLVNETDPTKKAELRRQFEGRVATLTNQVNTAVDKLGRMGVVEGGLSVADTTRALNLNGRSAEFSKEIAGLFTAPTFDAAGKPVGPPDAVEVRRRFGEFWKTESGKLFGETARSQGSAASDVALKLLSSPESVDRLGLAGVKHAKQITESNQELLRLAAVHTGGDIGKLVAGDFAATMPAKEREEVAERVRQQVAARDKAVKEIYDLQHRSGRTWDAKATAAELGVSEADAQLAHSMDPTQVRAALAAKDLTGEARARAVEKLGPNGEDMIRAAGVYERMRGKAADAMAAEHMAPDKMARTFLERYGVTPGETDAERERLHSLGRMLKTEAGQALYYGLTTGQDYLAGVAERGGIKGAKGVERVDGLYREYQKLLQTPEAEKEGAERAFREKFKLGDKDDYAQFQRAMQLQVETGFIRFGDSGLGQRTDFNLAKAEEMLGRKLATGQLNGEDKKVKVEFPNGMTITGRLKVDGTLDARTEGANTPGANHANTGGN